MDNDTGPEAPESAVDVETAIRADIDRSNVDARSDAEALATFYMTLTIQSNMTQELAQHLTAVYQNYLLASDPSDEED